MNLGSGVRLFREGPVVCRDNSQGQSKNAKPWQQQLASQAFGAA